MIFKERLRLGAPALINSLQKIEAEDSDWNEKIIARAEEIRKRIKKGRLIRPPL